MASCVVSCGSGGESSGSETPGSSCLQFGVRSYLHHFYEDCSSSSMSDREPEEQGFAQTQRSRHCWSSGIWKMPHNVSLALGLLILTAGVASLSVGYSTPRRIESFGDGDLLFVDRRAVSFNGGLHVSVAAGLALSCLGSVLAVAGVLLWAQVRGQKLPPQREEVVEGMREWGTEVGGALKGAGEEAVATAPPAAEEGKVVKVPMSCGGESAPFFLLN